MAFDVGHEADTARIALMRRAVKALLCGKSEFVGGGCVVHHTVLAGG
jgi:hypothetical protein